MPVIYCSTLLNDRSVLAATAIDAGSTLGGFLSVLSSTGTLASLRLGYPAASVSGPTITFSAPQSDPDATGGTGVPSEVQFLTSGGLSIITGLSVGQSGSVDVTIVSTQILPHHVVRMTSFTIDEYPSRHMVTETGDYMVTESGVQMVTE